MAGSSRITPLGTGVTDIQRYTREDDVRLPEAPAKREASFVPEVQPLNAILHKMDLDERLTLDIVPEQIDEALLQPGTLSETRLSLAAYLQSIPSGNNPATHAAVSLLQTEIELDDEVREALAALLRG